jgi:quercetin dioxygenase-like cupin family protein
MTATIQVRAPGEGIEYVAPDATLTAKITGEHTGGAYELFEVDAQRGQASPPHTEAWGKAFYVLQGRILVQVGGEGYDLGPGSSITIPAGTVNTFSVLTPAAKFLLFSQTDAMGRFFADLDRLGSADAETLRDLTGRHGVTLSE